LRSSLKVDTNEVVLKLKRFESAAQQAGLKLTHQRLEIFREIASRMDHPDAIKIYNSVKERIPTVSLDTVYRTLWTLNDLGLITIFGYRQESVRFDANLGQHHHFVCVKCGLIRDFENGGFDALKVGKEVREFGSILGTRIEVRGICNSCGGISDEIVEK